MNVCYGAEPAGIYANLASGPQYVLVLVPNQHAGKHNCTRPSGMYMYAVVAPDQQPCLYSYKLHTISIHVSYSFILSASMYITFARDHQPCLKQLHLTCIFQLHITSSHVCKTCAYKHACLRHLHQSSIHMCYSDIKPSVLSIALAPDQYSSNVFYNCAVPADLYFTVTPNHATVKIVTKRCSMHVFGPTWVYLLDFFCSSIQFYLLLSPYLCFISFLYLDLYVLGVNALIS